MGLQWCLQEFVTLNINQKRGAIMNVLVIGRGGRSSAIARKLFESKQVGTVFAAPGNPGMTDVATLVPIDENNHRELVAFAKNNAVALTVIRARNTIVEWTCR